MYFWKRIFWKLYKGSYAFYYWARARLLSKPKEYMKPLHLQNINDLKYVASRIGIALVNRFGEQFIFSLKLTAEMANRYRACHYEKFNPELQVTRKKFETHAWILPRNRHYLQLTKQKKNKKTTR